MPVVCVVVCVTPQPPGSVDALAMAEDQKWKPTTNAKYGIGNAGTDIHTAFVHLCMYMYSV